MVKNAREMIAGWFENERPVIEQVSQPLDGPVKIRRGRIDKKKMLKRLRDELPAADERIAQNQSGVVPDKIVSQGRRVESQGDESQKKWRQDFFQRRNWVDRSNKMRV